MDTSQYTNQQLRELLAAQAKTLNKTQLKDLVNNQEAAVEAIDRQYKRTKPEETMKGELGRVERALLQVPGVVNLVTDIGNTLTTITQAMIPASLPLLLVFLIFAEAERVRYGVMLFEVHLYLSYIVAYILVIGNAFVELAIQAKHARHGYEQRSGYEFSLRIWFERVAYTIGLGSQWQPREKSPALRLERLQRGLTAAILFLAIGGSMTAAIEQTTGNWREGLVSIAVDSSLLEMLTWLSGLVAAVVIVLLAQAIVAYAFGEAVAYYNTLQERKEQVEGTRNPALETWEAKRDAAIEQARQQAEREVLLAALAKEGVSLVAPVQVEEQVIDDPKEAAMYTNGNGHHG